MIKKIKVPLFSDDENKCDKDLKTGLERCSWTSSRVVYCSLKLHQKSVEGGQEVRETEKRLKYAKLHKNQTVDQT